jgi:RNA polymerase sigma-70 factor (ECF subfamily)
MPANIPPSDGDCVRQCLRGDPEAFRTLVLRYQTPLLAFARGKIPNAADEIAQESFVRAFRQLNRLQKFDSFFPWLLGIADRVAREFLRTDARHHRAVVRLASRRLAETDPPQHENDLQLDRAVAALPEQYREIVLLRYYADLSCAQVAQQLDLPLGTVTKRLSRAYALLRDVLAPQAALQERSSHELYRIP